MSSLLNLMATMSVSAGVEMTASAPSFGFEREIGGKSHGSIRASIFARSMESDGILKAHRRRGLVVCVDNRPGEVGREGRLVHPDQELSWPFTLCSCYR